MCIVRIEEQDEFTVIIFTEPPEEDIKFTENAGVNVALRDLDAAFHGFTYKVSCIYEISQSSRVIHKEEGYYRDIIEARKAAASIQEFHKNFRGLF